ncbi:MAG: M48 family metalloprotease [Thermodesulfobacteriota bacterium]
MYRRRQAPMRYSSGFSGRRGGKGRLLIGLAFAAFAFFSYCSSKEYNPVTGEEQYVSLTPKQEIAIGLQSTPQMIEQYGGLYPDQRAQDFVDKIGNRLLKNSEKISELPWEFEFHLLRDPEAINAFALPGGQVFITQALFSRLQTEGQLAGVLGHEIGHVVARHGAQRIAKSELTQGLTGAVMTASGDAGSAQMAAMIGQMINMKYGREDELQSDELGIKLMSKAGYDPRSMIGVMEILAAASSGNRQPEFFSTHPNPENRIEKIRSAIQEVFPSGVPSGLEP